MRLSVRLRYILSTYYSKIRSLLSKKRRSSRPRSNSSSQSRLGSLRRAQKQWEGEQAAPLWPEWEQFSGQLALHGPFLFNQDKSGTGNQGNSIELTALLSRMLSKTSLAQRRASAAHREGEIAKHRLHQAISLLNFSAYPPLGQRASPDALWVLAQHHILGTHGTEPQPWKARAHLEHLVDSADPGNSSARSLLGWIEGSRELWKAWGADLLPELYAGQSQSRSLLHHSFAAQEGNFGSMMALAYRHHAGIGTPVDCELALKWYTRAATTAWVRYKDGPIGGLTVPYTHLRLTDLAGGAYGPGASAASTGWEAHRPAVQAALHSLKGSAVPSTKSSGKPSKLNDLLEYYAYHAQGGSITNAVRLARIYYFGSIYGTSESAGRVERDFAKARDLSLKVTRHVWPVDVSGLRMVDGKRVVRAASSRNVGTTHNGVVAYEPDIILKAETPDKMVAAAAAALLGRMYLRGEGVPVDYHKAWMWFWRGADVADRDCLYGYGLMRSLGLAPDQLALSAAKQTSGAGPKSFPSKAKASAKNVDWKGAVDAWEKAIRAGGPAGHAEASVALGKLHFDMGDITSAARHFAHSVTWGSPFEGHYMLAMVNANLYKKSVATLARAEGSDDVRCHAAVVHFKQAAERGDWESPVFYRGMRAWELGDSRRALVFWSMAAERGDEAAENNLAWILDRDKRRWKLPRLDGDESSSSDRVSLIYWTRSAAQGNVDAMVKMGDYYFHGIGVTETDDARKTEWPTEREPNNATGHASPDAQSPTSRNPSYEKALACYAAAADRQVSALAYWNLGFLYEEGLGVPRRDFHLAKRYYDMALTTNGEAYLPVMLSLIKLHVKALWATVWKREESAVALFSSYGSGGARLGGYTEAQEEILRAGAQGYDDEGAAGDFEFGGDPNLPESYEFGRHQGQQPQQQQQQQQRSQDGLQRKGDGFNGHRVGPEGEAGRGDAGGGGETGSGSGGSGTNLMSLSEDEADAMIEGAMIVIGLSALAMLVYARQAAQARVEQERREQEQRRLEAIAQDPTFAAQIREAETLPRGSRYAGGLPWPPDAAGPQMGL